MVDNIDERRRKVLIFDGGTGREIERCGGPFRQPEWSALALYERPDVVRQVHERFLEAGAQAITTNTYATVPFHLGEERYKKDSQRLLTVAVDLAHQAVTNHRKKESNEKYKESSATEKVQIQASIPPL